MSKGDHAITVRWGGLTIPLLVLFIALKLTGEIDWHWAWVVSPAWLPLVVVLGAGLVFCVVAAACLGIAALILATVEMVQGWVRR